MTNTKERNITVESNNHMPSEEGIPENETNYKIINPILSFLSD